MVKVLGEARINIAHGTLTTDVSSLDILDSLSLGQACLIFHPLVMEM